LLRSISFFILITLISFIFFRLCFAFLTVLIITRYFRYCNTFLQFFLFYYKGGSILSSFCLFFLLFFLLHFFLIYFISIKFIFFVSAVLYVPTTLFIRTIDYPYLDSIPRDRLIRLVGGYVNARDRHACYN